MWCPRTDWRWMSQKWGLLDNGLFTLLLHEVRRFHGLVSFSRHFIHEWCIMVPITECMKEGKFSWSDATTTAFELIKLQLTMTPLLVLPYFDLPFELHFDASKVGIGAVLSQGGKPVEYFSYKLSGPKLNYNTYDVEFYALVQYLKHWSTYLAYNYFILYLDHEALKHQNSHTSARSWVGRSLIIAPMMWSFMHWCSI